MNIKKASEQIEGAVRAYLLKDEHGMYKIPFHMQRPIIVMGPPGVGKTAIVSQVADRLGINFVSYSITHHTRQSALGLPFIEKESFGGREFSVSEYTMSEIIASAWRAMEASGVGEGILFLDEVNCVSETLAPAMLQFLQYKTFGTHRLPEGWVVVTAGNPPEYNRSAREFDAAMSDRLKRIDVKPDLDVWTQYAVAHGVHPAVLSFLSGSHDRFYLVQADVQGARIVTPRGWEDLSRMLLAYEELGLAVDEALVGQYLQDGKTAREFTLYYELFRKYRDGYRVRDIMAGSWQNAIVKRAQAAKFDERVALTGLFVDALLCDIRQVMVYEEALRAARSDLLGMKKKLCAPDADAAGCVQEAMDAIAARPDVSKQAVLVDKKLLGAVRLEVLGRVRDAVERFALGGDGATGVASAFDAAKASFNADCKKEAAEAARCSSELDAALRFYDEAFGGKGQEALVLVTKLTVDQVFVSFVTAHPSASYVQHSKQLLLRERRLDLLDKVKALKELSADE